MIGHRLFVLLLYLIAATPAVAKGSLVEFAGEVRQSALIVARTLPGAKVALDGKPLRVSPDGHFVFGFGRDHGARAALAVETADGRSETRLLEVARRDYLIQRIDNLPPAMVTPPPETLERIRREQALLSATRRLDTPNTWFAEGFRWPVIGPISGVFGSQRILNGQPRAPHLGVDVAAPTGTPIVAPATGIVLLAEPDFYYTGGTVVLDHGHGVSSIYMHMSKLLVGVQQRVQAGEVIGEVGATGRVTGPHLHWGLYWFDRPVDAQPLAGEMPKR